MPLPKNPAPPVWELNDWPPYNSRDYWGVVTRLTEMACLDRSGPDPGLMPMAQQIIDQYGLRCAPDLMAMALCLLDRSAAPEVRNTFGVPMMALCLPLEMQEVTSFQAGVILADETATADPTARAQRFQDGVAMGDWAQTVMGGWRKLFQAALYTRPASDGGDTPALRRAAMQLRRGPGMDGVGGTVPGYEDDDDHQGREEVLTGVILAWAMCRYGMGGGAQYKLRPR